MPAPKGSLPENLTSDDENPWYSHHHHHHHHHQLSKQSRAQDEAEVEVEAEEENEGEEDEEREQNDLDEAYYSERSLSSTSHEKSEFIYVRLSDVRKDVCCPICLGIIKKTRTVIDCLHRFCRQCIDKSLRMGNNECPVCRTYCASQHSLRDDPNYDALIAALYPDIDKHEDETFMEGMSTLNLYKQTKEPNSVVDEHEKDDGIDQQAGDHDKKSTGVFLGAKRYCQGDNCTADLSEAKKYHRKLKVCDHHSKAQVVLVSGLRQRFCQQCSRFHEVSEFEDTKRSCRRRLAGHNARRRKNYSVESHTEGSSCNGTTGTQLNVVGGQVDDTGRIRYIEDFVSGHFRNRAHNILVACKSYTEGGYFGRICHPGDTAQNAGAKYSRQFKSTLVPRLLQIAPKMNQQTGSSLKLDPNSHVKS